MINPGSIWMKSGKGWPSGSIGELVIIDWVRVMISNIDIHREIHMDQAGGGKYHIS